MWKVSYFDDALEDLKKLDNSQRKQVLKAIDKVKTNPLPQNEGGYGKPLGNKRGINLTNLYKIKLKKSGIRVVYQIIRVEDTMEIIIVSMREDEKVYEDAQKRINNK
jgi:mRNA interferase RelE/StbE